MVGDPCMGSLMTRYYGGDAPTAVRVVVAPNLLALATIPLWLALGVSLVH